MNWSGQPLGLNDWPVIVRSFDHPHYRDGLSGGQRAGHERLWTIDGEG